jgi:outer membrane protein assembly factor BamB
MHPLPHHPRPRLLGLCLVLSGLIGLIGLIGLMTPPLAAQHWPAFRGDNADGTADGAKPPLHWNADKGENLLWKTPIPGIAHSSPIVWGDKVFVTTAVNTAGESDLKVGLYGDVKPAEDTTLHEWSLYALDLKSGKVLWHQVALKGVPKVKRHPKASHANSTPVTDGQHVVAILGSDTLFAYSIEGELQWQVDLGTLDAGWFYDPTYQWGHASSPILYKDRVLVQVDRQKNSYLAAYRLTDGKELWRTERDTIPSWATPTLIEDKTEAGSRTLLVASGTPTIGGYDVETGKELWTLGPMSEIAVGTPVVRQDVVYVTGGYSPVRPIYAVKAGARGKISLEEKTEDPNLAWAVKTGGTYMPTPIVYGDYLYTLANNGVLACFNATTGEEIYRQRVAGGGVGYSGSPVAADGHLYLPTEDGDIHVVKAGPEYALVGTNTVGEVIMTTPAIVPGTFLVRGKGHLFAFGETAVAAPEEEAPAPLTP